METRIAVIGIVVEEERSVELLNEILHEYRDAIIGRMGIPYRQKGISIISIAVDAPADTRPVGQGGQAAGGQLENSLRRGEKVSALQKLAETLAACHNLEDGELLLLLRDSGPHTREFLRQQAQAQAQAFYGSQVFIRGLIEFTNFCKNDCYYCGIRRSNPQAQRYRLSQEQILACCQAGYGLGFRTFVLQGGEDPLVHRRAPVRHGPGHQGALAGLRRHSFRGGAQPGELPPAEGGRGR